MSGNPTTVTLGPLAASSATNIALSQALAAAGNLVLNGATVAGGIATLDVARRVLLTNTGNDTGITYTIFGTNTFGIAISEAFAGPNAGTYQTINDFKTVTKVSASGAVAANVEVGTSGVASTQWFILDQQRNPTNVGMRFNVTGVVNYSLEETMDDPNVIANNPIGGSTEPQSNVPPVCFDDAVVSGKTTSLTYQMQTTVFAFRLKLNSETAGAGNSVQMQSVPAGGGIYN
jgi:hypothetical protein